MRRLIIITLITLALAVAVVDWTAFLIPIRVDIPISDSRHAYVYFDEGLIRMYLYRATDPIDTQFSDDGRRVDFVRVADNELCARILHAPATRISNYAIVQNQFTAATATATAAAGALPPTVVRLDGIRTTGVSVLAVLVVFPFFAAVREQLRRRRKRDGHCRNCDYDLTGNTSGLCPECGEAWTGTAVISSPNSNVSQIPRR